MRTLRLLLEYGCEPVWIYGEDGLVEETGLPKEISNNKQLLDLMWKIMTKFDSQYINSEKEFEGIGFKKEADKKEFKQDLIKFSSMIKEAVGDKYKFVDDFNYEDY